MRLLAESHYNMALVNTVPTLEDVANLAGVSKCTASRILAAPEGVRVPYAPATKRKVLDATAKLGYKPSKLARGLTLAKTGIIGLVVPSLTDSFFPSVTSALEARLTEAGYSVILANSNADSRTQRARIEDLLAWHVDGLMIAPTQEAGEAGLFWELWQRKTPFVLLDRTFQETPFCSVSTEDETGAAMAVEHLFATGCRRIACAGGPLGISTNRLRHAGYTAALIRHGLLPRLDYAVEAPPCEEEGQNALTRILALNPRPDAVFCFSDLLAFGILEACGRQGIRVPQDLAVVGYADLPHSGMLKVALTTVRQPRALLGRRAAEVLLASIGKSGHSEQVTLPVELVIRESTGGLASPVVQKDTKP
jgi:LacI family transcriptional regulator